jgi:hypothetical protein
MTNARKQNMSVIIIEGGRFFFMHFKWMLDYKSTTNFFIDDS